MGLLQNIPDKAFGGKKPEFTKRKWGFFSENETPYGGPSSNGTKSCAKARI